MEGEEVESRVTGGGLGQVSVCQDESVLNALKIMDQEQLTICPELSLGMVHHRFITRTIGCREAVGI